MTLTEKLLKKIGISRFVGAEERLKVNFLKKYFRSQFEAQFCLDMDPKIDVMGHQPQSKDEEEVFRRDQVSLSSIRQLLRIFH